MSQIRNWPKTLPLASFKGFEFYYEREGLGEGGRLVAVHPYAKGETHATEDMGRKARLYSITGYVEGNDADIDGEDLIEVCSSPGPGLLVMPVTGAVMVRCRSVQTSNDKTRMGYVAFSMDFIEAGDDGGGFPAIPLGDLIAEAVLDVLPDIVGDLIALD